MLHSNYKRIRYDVNKTFEKALKHKSSNILKQKQLINKPIMIEIYVVQKILLVEVNKFKDLINRTELKEFDMDEYNNDRETQRSFKENICNEYLTIKFIS
jgi:hypothetical protein